MGNRDVPDWLLAEVATLSRIASAVHQVETQAFAPLLVTPCPLSIADLCAAEADLQASDCGLDGRQSRL